MSSPEECINEQKYKDVMKTQIGCDYYNSKSIQPWHIIDVYELNFYEGNVLKFLLRKKGDRVEDLQKAIHYLEKEIINIKEKNV